MGATKTSVEEDIKATAMALRETIMEYFKGSCVERLVTSNNIRVTSIENGRAEFQYQRRHIEEQNRKLVSLSGVPLFSMHKMPDTLTFYEDTFKRSPQLRAVNAELSVFMDKYLIGVEIKTEKGRIYA
jgi:hypothetical protein